MAPTTDVVSIEEITLAYEAAIRLARAVFPPGIQQDVAIDRVTDAVMRASQKYESDRGTPFAAFADRCARMAIRYAYTIANRTLPLNESSDQVFTNDATTALDCDRLPAPLRAVYTFHCVYGFTLNDTGLLCGVSREGAAKRLRRAARMMVA